MVDERRVGRDRDTVRGMEMEGGRKTGGREV